MAPETPHPPLRLFLFSADEDQGLRDELLKHLAVFRALGEVQTWSADSVPAGDDWKASADAAIREVDAALVLLSADFLAGELAQDARTPELMERLRDAGRPIIPVLLRTCLWRHHPWLASLQALPKDGEAISAREGDARDRVLAEVVSAIVESLSERRGDSPAPLLPAAPPPGTSRPRPREEDGWRLPSRRVVLGSAAAVVALAVGLVGWRLLGPGSTANAIQAEVYSGCPAGRQKYEGACVADKMVDLLVCLKQSGATGALGRAEEVVRARPPDGTDPADARVSREVSASFAGLSEDERRRIVELCKEAADRAGVTVLVPKPEPTPSITTTTTTTTPLRKDQKPPAPTPAPPPASCKKANELCKSSVDCCSGLVCKETTPSGGLSDKQSPPAPRPMCVPK
jgi:hypothetical protein